MNHENRQYLKVGEIQKKIQFSDPFPCVVEIHPSQVCNNHCKYCFHHGELLNTSKSPLMLKEYIELFKEMKKLGILNLSISGGGEPTMNKQLVDIIKKASKNYLSVRLVTNGNVISPGLFDSLKLIDEVRFSMDAINDKTYSKIRNVPTKMFDITIDNLKKMIQLRDSKKMNFKIGVTYLLNKFNYQEIFDFCKKMLKLKVDSIIIKDDVYEKFKINDDLSEKIMSKIEKIKSNRIEFRKPKCSRINETKCFMPYFKIAIDTFGMVYSCCLAAQPGSKEGFVLGDVMQKSLSEIWEESSERRFIARTCGVNCNFCNYTDSNLNNLFKN